MPGRPEYSGGLRAPWVAGGYVLGVRPGTANSNSAQEFIGKAQRRELDETPARRLYEYGPEVVILALLAVSKRIAGQDAQIAELQSRLQGSPVTPSRLSGMVPVYTKPNTNNHRKRARGRKGHTDARSPRPQGIGGS